MKGLKNRDRPTGPKVPPTSPDDLPRTPRVSARITGELNDVLQKGSPTGETSIA